MTPRTPVEPEEIREQLSRILESSHFRNSRRCSAFLRHVVEASTDGRAADLKERALGAAIFERPLDYDTNQDPIVRNTAGQLRKRLAQYYHEPGHERELRINLPPGSYVPEISPPPGLTQPEPAMPPESPASPATPLAIDGRPLRRRAAAMALLALVPLAALTLYFTRHTAPTELESFWAPVLKFAGPVTICVGQGHPYRLPEAWDDYFEGIAGESPKTSKPAAAIPIDSVTPAWDRYIGISDAQAVIRFSGLFSRHGKEVTLRGGRSTSLADLRRKPVVLVGAFNNRWTMELSGELRFYFDGDGDDLYVRDRQHPENHSWRLTADPKNPQMQTDYAIISRVYNPTTEQFVVAVGGIKGPGTYVASEFVTNPAYLKDALAKAPRDWAEKNAQFVLATKVYSGTPAPPQVVAAHYW